MIHICKVKTGFMVVVTAKNGEALVTSEILKTKQSAWKNVTAIVKNFDTYTASIQDDTFPKPILYFFYYTGNKWRSMINKIHQPVPRYIPGRNPKKTKRT